MAKIDIADIAPREIMGRILACAEYYFDEYRKAHFGDPVIFQSILTARLLVGKLVYTPNALTPREKALLTKVYTLAKNTVPQPNVFPTMSVKEFQASVFLACPAKL